MAGTMAGTLATPSMLKSGFAAAATAVALKRFHQPVPKHGVTRDGARSSTMKPDMTRDCGALALRGR
jgi:hypothetical protein